MAYRSIAISGPVASGTTTAAEALSQKLNLEYHSAGDFFRKYMSEHNIPLPQKEKIPDAIERKVDGELTELLASEKGVIVDGLYAGYFAKDMDHVLKVLLTADENERLKRAAERSQNETAQDVMARDKAHDAKFRKLYADVNFLDPKFFDLVIDNSNIEAEEVVSKISEKFLGNRPTRQSKLRI